MRNKLTLAAVATLALAVSGIAGAEEELPVPGFPAARDLPGAPNSPDPNIEYKVVFDLVVEDDNLDDPYPMLRPLAIYVNTLAKFGGIVSVMGVIGNGVGSIDHLGLQ